MFLVEVIIKQEAVDNEFDVLDVLDDKSLKLCCKVCEKEVKNLSKHKKSFEEHGVTCTIRPLVLFLIMRI